MILYATEKKLWGHLAPRLLGKWWRTEYVTPEGLSDAMGFWRGRVHYIELKVGRPALKSLRPMQRDFVLDCMHHGISVWCAFSWQNSVFWTMGAPAEDPVNIPPPFYRGP